MPTSGREIVASLPPCDKAAADPHAQAQEIADRERALLEAIKTQQVRTALDSVLLHLGRHELKVLVTSDALMVGPVEPVRFNCSATLLQRIADYYGALLLTSKVSDAIDQQAAVKITPCIMKPDALMASTARMLAHHDAVEEKRAGRTGMISTVCKDWILSNRLGTHPLGKDRAAINYGWHDVHAPNGKVWQPNGAAHDRYHVDYSQCARFMLRDAMLDGVRIDLFDILKDPNLCALVSDEGPILFERLPGVVLDPSSIGGMTTPPPAPTTVAANQFDPTAPYEFIKARNYTPSSGRTIRLVVIHAMEAAEKPGTAKAVANWFASVNAPKASAHYCVDAGVIVQCVHEEDVAWHAPGANAVGIGIEHAGYSSQSAADWSDAYSKQMLERSAALVADLCDRHDLPIEFVDVDGLLAEKSGITTHAAVSKAFKKSDHTDPGPNFPIDAFLALVRGA